MHRCHTGTKQLVEIYVNEVVRQLRNIAAADESVVDRTTLKEYLGDMLHSYGRSALLLHGGASFGLCHLGVAKALFEAGMLPDILCGSYIGALAAAIIGVNDDDGLRRVFAGHIDIGAFRNHGPQGSWQRRISRLLKHGRLFDIRVVEEAARANIGDVTFREAFAKSGRILNITVRARRKHEVPLLLNHLSAPDVLVWSAACASCATPGIYETCMLFAKDPVTGSIVPWHPSALHLDSVSVDRYTRSPHNALTATSLLLARRR